MEVMEIIDEKVIKTNLQARNKDEALQELAKLLQQEGYISDLDGFIKDIYIRESQGITGIGNYIAIPHGRSKAVRKIGVAIGVLENEIAWETLDDLGVKGIILFAVGDDNDGALNHLRLLSMFARKLGKDEVIEELLSAKNAAEVARAFY